MVLVLVVVVAVGVGGGVGGVSNFQRTILDEKQGRLGTWVQTGKLRNLLNVVSSCELHYNWFGE